MYEPPLFRVEDRDAVVGVVRAHPFGLLISTGEDGVIANPVPFLLIEQADGGLTLRAHVARPNPHWQALKQSPDVLVIFQGLDHYVTPSWYETKRESGKVVPTWNYQHVQMRGSATIHEDAAFLREQVGALTSQHEESRAAPWAVEDAPAAYIEAQLRGIVGIEIAVKSWSGKFKLSQNRNEADRAGVIKGLTEAPDAAGQRMAELMKAQAGKIKP